MLFIPGALSMRSQHQEKKRREPAFGKFFHTLSILEGAFIKNTDLFIF